MRGPDFALRTVASLRRVLSKRHWAPVLSPGGSLSFLDGQRAAEEKSAQGEMVKRLWKASGRGDGCLCQGGGGERWEIASEDRVDVYAFPPPFTGDFSVHLSRTGLRNFVC